MGIRGFDPPDIGLYIGVVFMGNTSLAAASPLGRLKGGSPRESASLGAAEASTDMDLTHLTDAT